MKEKIILYLKDTMISSIKFMYKWLTNDAEILGFILAVLHILVSISLLLCSFLAHTVYPIWQFKLGTFFFMVLVWLQHIFLNVCIFTVAELSLSLIPPSNQYLAYFYSFFLGTNVSEALTRLVMAETIGIACFGLELISLFCEHLYTLYNIQL
jgi:hypothetical protein